MSFRPAVLHSQSIPPAIEKDLVAASDLLPGALVLRNGSDEWAECGADPASVAAVAVTGGGADTDGFRLPANREFPPGRLQAIPIQATKRWTAEFVGTKGDIGTSYGVVKDSDGQWKVDFAEVTALVVVFVSDDLDEDPLDSNRVVVEFLDDVVQVV